MIVVSDTSPINYLILIGEIDCLRDLFEQVLLPVAVARELSSPDAPADVRSWVQAAPSWVEIQSAPSPSAHELLGAGELEAISLACASDALLLADDAPAREVARSYGVQVTGTLGVLERAAAEGYFDLPAVLAKLQATNFRISPALIATALERNRARKHERLKH